MLKTIAKKNQYFQSYLI